MTKLSCHWCGISLATASIVTYLNGNLPICDLCLRKSSVTDKKCGLHSFAISGNSLHDTLSGPCSCGAWHTPKDFKCYLSNIYNDKWEIDK